MCILLCFVKENSIRTLLKTYENVTKVIRFFQIDTIISISDWFSMTESRFWLVESALSSVSIWKSFKWIVEINFIENLVGLRSVDEIIWSHDPVWSHEFCQIELYVYTFSSIWCLWISLCRIWFWWWLIIRTYLLV